MRRLVWLFAALVGSGAVAAGLLIYLQRPGKGNAARVQVASQPSRPAPKTAGKSTAPSPTKTSGKTQTSDETAASKSGDDGTKPLQKPVNVSPNAGNTAAAEATPVAPPSPAKTDEPLELMADPRTERPPQPKGTIDEGPTGVPVDAPPKPEPLGIPDKPKLGVVADTPKGLYAERTQPKTPQWLAQRGGTIESQKAVDAGLNWLARHQGQDGHWGADCLGIGPNSRCERNDPCTGAGGVYEAAHTGLALLAFQAAGHYYFNGQKYSAQVAKGLDSLVQHQAGDGSIVGSQNPSPEQMSDGAPFNSYFMYEHAMATFAMCEACAVAIAERKKPDPRYRRAAQHAVFFIEDMQHNDGGWRYSPNVDAGSDTSVSGWVMLALKTAHEAQLKVLPQTISKMMGFFSAHYANGQTYYQFGNVTTRALTGVGMMAIEFFQHTLDSPVVQNGAALLADRGDGVPLNSSNYYNWYNCTMAMFQVGGEPWERWNGAVRDRVIALQVQGQGCDRGSWLPNDRWSKEGGRIYSTALAVLTLEVYYRFQRVAGPPENAKFFDK